MRNINYRWIVLASGFVILFFNGGSRFAFGLMLKPMTEDSDWSRSSLSLVVATFMVVSALSMPLVGRLIDIYGTKMVMAVGAIIGGVGIGLVYYVSSLWQLFLVYGLIYAVGHAATNIAPVGIWVSRWFPQNRGIATSVAVAGNAGGQLVIISILASLAVSLGWRISYGLLAIANLVVVVPIVLKAVKPRSREGPLEIDSRQTVLRERSDSAFQLSTILKSKEMCILILVYTICGFQDFFVATHVVAFALDHDVPNILAGNLLALMGVMGVIGVLISGLMSDSFGASRPTVLCFAIRIGAFALILWSQSMPFIILFAMAYGFTFLITAPLTVVFAQNLFGSSQVGTITGIINMVHQIAGGVGAFVGAAMFDYWGGYDGMFVLILALSAVALVATTFVDDKQSAAKIQPTS
ncbi:MFS transporter [SAR202 cluster bacterium AD-804-J14_MRT_500m]|nr:MFS transporter [SAR202 cluster bacterium AD-804-J14_MRT_500m]